MPVAYWNAYKAKSKELSYPMKHVETMNQFTNKELMSDSCMQKIKDAACVRMYCTEDEKSVIVPNLQDNCDEVMKW